MSESATKQIARKAMRDAFKQFDFDNSAMLLRKLADSFHVEIPSDDDIKVVFQQLDLNGDGRISKKQFDNLVDEVVKIVQDEHETK